MRQNQNEKSRIFMSINHLYYILYIIRLYEFFINFIEFIIYLVVDKRNHSNFNKISNIHCCLTSINRFNKNTTHYLSERKIPVLYRRSVGDAITQVTLTTVTLLLLTT